MTSKQDEAYPYSVTSTSRTDSKPSDFLVARRRIGGSRNAHLSVTNAGSKSHQAPTFHGSEWPYILTTRLLSFCGTSRHGKVSLPKSHYIHTRCLVALANNVFILDTVRLSIDLMLVL